MCLLLAGPALVDRRVPPAAQLLERAHVDAAVVQVLVDRREIPVEESAIDADRVPAQRRAASGTRALRYSSDLGAGVGEGERRCLDLREQARTSCASSGRSRPCARAPPGVAWMTRSMPSSTSSRSESVTSTAISTMVCRSVSSPVISRSIQTSASGEAGAGVARFGRCSVRERSSGASRDPTRAPRYPAPVTENACCRWTPSPELPPRATSGGSWPRTASTTSRRCGVARSKTRSGSGTRSSSSSESRSRRRTRRCSTSRRGSSGRRGSPTAGLNAAAVCVDRWADDPERCDHPAILWEGEDGAAPLGDLRRAPNVTDAIAGGLAARGVGEGDAVGVFLPMLPETVADGDGRRQARRDLPADLLRVRRRGGRGAARGGRGQGARHRRRHDPPGQGRPDEGDRRRRAGVRSPVSRPSWSFTGSASTCRCTPAAT